MSLEGADCSLLPRREAGPATAGFPQLWWGCLHSVHGEDSQTLKIIHGDQNHAGPMQQPYKKPAPKEPIFLWQCLFSCPSAGAMLVTPTGLPFLPFLFTALSRIREVVLGNGLSQRAHFFPLEPWGLFSSTCLDVLSPAQPWVYGKHFLLELEAIPRHQHSGLVTF